jgi:hypothetical protein
MELLARGAEYDPDNPPTMNERVKQPDFPGSYLTRPVMEFVTQPIRWRVA